jgi:alkanesulfonate monooxygenase
MHTDVAFHSVLPRSVDLGEAAVTVRQAIRWSADAGLDGILIYTGAGSLLDPWVAATTVLAQTERLHPMVAVNPVYQHPYTTARMLLSLGLLYGRRVDLNLITGTAVRDLESLGDAVAHDDRYVRLGEYADIVLSLLRSARPLDFDGHFYHVAHLQLSPPFPRRLLPELFVAGHSPSARELAGRLAAANIRMLSSAGQRDAAAVSFGLVARPNIADAVRAAQEWFPEDLDGRSVLAASVLQNDSTWVRELFEVAERGDYEDFYRLAPFRSMQADCPYLVGDYESMVAQLVGLARGGVRTFIVDVPMRECDFRHLARVADLVREHLRTEARPAPSRHHS